MVLDARSTDYQQSLRSLAAVDDATRTCLGTALRTRLAGIVAPPIQLYLAGAGVATPPTLSSDGVRRVAAASALILLATVALCLLAATGLRRPLADLTVAVQAVAAGERGAVLTPRGTREAVDLAVAVNTLSARLEEAERRRQEMVGDVAHELRGPLGTIRGWMEAVHTA